MAAAFMADRDAFAQRNPDTHALKVFDQHMASFLAVHQKVVSFVKRDSPSTAATRLREVSTPLLKSLHEQLAAWSSAGAASTLAEAKSAAAAASLDQPVQNLIGAVAVFRVPGSAQARMPVPA